LYQGRKESHKIYRSAREWEHPRDMWRSYTARKAHQEIQQVGSTSQQLKETQSNRP